MNKANHPKILSDSECRAKLSGLSTGKIGAIHEYAISIDLMRRGFELFRAMSPSQSCDLVALWSGKCYRIECKTALRTSDGDIRMPTCDQSKYDVLAAICHNGDIVYSTSIKDMALKCILDIS